MTTAQIADFETSGEVIINGKPYLLVRQPSTSLDYQIDYENEPPYNQGNPPPLVSTVQSSWHWGGFKSQEGVENTYEYGLNVDTRFPYRLLPSPKIHPIVIGGVALPISKIFFGLGYVWVMRGGTQKNLYRIDPATLTVTLSRTFGGTFGPRDGVQWEQSQIYLTTGESAQSLWNLATPDIVPGGPDTWHQTPDVFVANLAVGINRLFGIDANGKLRNISTNLGPLLNVNWADSVQVGALQPPVSMVPYERSVIIGNQEGYFSVGEEGFGVPIIKRIVPSFLNGLNPCNFDPWLLLPHWRGIYRWQPGIVQACGIETELLNQSPVHGFVSAVVSEGEWVYAMVDDNSVTYLLAGRERRSGEQGFGPMIWHTLLYWASNQLRNGTMFITTSTLNETRLYFSYGNDLAYITLGNNSAVPLDVTADPATNGFCYTNRYRFNDWGRKSFPKVNISCKNVDNNNVWSLRYSIDGGAWQITDIDGNAMDIKSTGIKTFWLPPTAVGTEIQWGISYACDGTKLPEVSYFESFAQPIPRQVPVIKFKLKMAESSGHIGGYDTRSAYDMYSDLEALTGSPTPVLSSGPWGDNLYGTVRSLRRATGYQEGNMEQIQIAEVEFQRRVTV